MPAVLSNPQTPPTPTEPTRSSLSPATAAPITSSPRRLSATPAPRTLARLTYRPPREPLAPPAALRSLSGRNAASAEYTVKPRPPRPGDALATSDHDRVMHAACERALDSLEDAVKAYTERLGQVAERRKAEAKTHQEVTP